MIICKHPLSGDDYYAGPFTFAFYSTCLIGGAPSSFFSYHLTQQGFVPSTLFTLSALYLLAKLSLSRHLLFRALFSLDSSDLSTLIPRYPTGE